MTFFTPEMGSWLFAVIFLLLIISIIYAMATRIRFLLTTPLKVKVPVICVGNVVAGGAGKTPTTIALAKLLKERGHTPHILSRGYKAPIKDPVHVDVTSHTATQVGDEPLLLAKAAPTWACPNRRASALAAIDAGADILIMDDGLQNPTLHKDISLLVIDGSQGIGNGLILPLGPLREPLEWALRRIDAVVLVGTDKKDIAKDITKPLMAASLQSINAEPKKVLAFTGLGFPDKFYNTLEREKYEVVATQSFRDHHAYQEAEIESLIREAKTKNARLITTEKDIVKIPKPYHGQIDVLKVQMEFKSIDALNTLLENHGL